MKEIKNIISLLLSTILMLKKSIIKDKLFNIMMKINKLSIQQHFENSTHYNLTEDMIEDINVILNNIDFWIRNYNSEMRVTMKRELLDNLKDLTNVFRELIG